MRSHLRWGAARHYISRKNDELVEREQESKSTLQPEDSDWMLKKKEKMLSKSIVPRVLGSTTACFFFSFFGARHSNEVYVAANFFHQQEDEERERGGGLLQ